MINLLEVKNLKKYYAVEKGVFRQAAGQVRAVDGVSFSIGVKETLGLVGESGCGKTTCGRLAANLLKPTSGEILFNEENIFTLRGSKLNEFRKKVQIVFQDPYSSLDPKQSIYDIVSEPIRIHHLYPSREVKDKVGELFRLVGLPYDLIHGYPHQLSGGQRQRIGIARALSLNPRLIIADEPVSSLDISIQAQIINLMQDLQEKYGLSYLFISHDLGVVKHIAHRVAVMYLGRIVELAESKELYHNPLHPYTRMLLASVPRIKKPGDQAPADKTAEAISAYEKGCAFYPRCTRKKDQCLETDPTFSEKGEKHFVSCWYPE